MANCKDCLHNNICNMKQRYNHPKYALQHIEKYCEHFKDRSRFVELPCKLGDVVFIVFDDRVLDCEVIRISFSEKYKNANLTLENKKSGTIYGFLSDGDSEFFFTREEAEQALKERERK